MKTKTFFGGQQVKHVKVQVKHERNKPHKTKLFFSKRTNKKIMPLLIDAYY